MYSSAAVLLHQGLILSDINKECKCILAIDNQNNPFLNKLTLQGIDMGVCVRIQHRCFGGDAFQPLTG